MILNFKKSNTSAEEPHLKMESVKNVTNMIHKNPWMILNLKHVYFTNPMHPDHQALLRFLMLFKSHINLLLFLTNMTMSCLSLQRF